MLKKVPQSRVLLHVIIEYTLISIIKKDNKISKFKNKFAKGYTPNWSREIFKRFK